MAPYGFFIAIAVWIYTAAVSWNYLRTVNRLVVYMKEAHGPAWSRLNRRFLGIWGIWPGTFYRSPRKAGVVEEMIFCWRRPLRHAELDKMLGKARVFAFCAMLGIVATIVSFALFDPGRYQ
jgi:hypothetical protein